jgi:hypothetical protein
MAVKVVQGSSGSPRISGGALAAYGAAGDLSAARQQISAASQIATHHYINADAAVQKLRSQSGERKRQRIMTEAEAFGLVEQLTLSLLSEEDGAHEAHYQLSHSSAREHLT